MLRHTCLELDFKNNKLNNYLDFIICHMIGLGIHTDRSATVSQYIGVLFSSNIIILSFLFDELKITLIGFVASTFGLLMHFPVNRAYTEGQILVCIFTRFDFGSPIFQQPITTVFNNFLKYCKPSFYSKTYKSVGKCIA